MNEPVRREFLSGSTGVRFRHRPAVAAAMAFALGICLDQYLNIPLHAWWMLSIVGFCAAILFDVGRRQGSPWRNRLASMGALWLLAVTGGVRQHLDWNIRAQNDVSSIVTSEAITIRIRGIIASPVEILESKFGPRIPSWMEMDRSTCRLYCEAYEEDGNWISISGNCRMDVSGHLVHVRVGDRVEVLGQLAQPRPPENPGSMDYGLFLRRQGISALLRVEHPVAIQKMAAVRTLSWEIARWREAIRHECLQILFSRLNPEQCGLASSLLIGDRTLLTDELQDQFAQTGTMHLLAISGLHVGILLGLVLALCRLAKLSARSIAIVLLLTVLTYVFITDLRPPVLRAGLLATIASLGMLRGNRIDRMNALALVALLLLIWHPADLLDIGAQLSFMAVGAILWSNDWRKTAAPEEGSLTRLMDELNSVQRHLKPARKYLRETYTMTVAVMLATLPVTIATFHLIAPIGIILNVLLIPYIGLVLGLGYLLLFGALLLPVSAVVLAVPFRWSLTLLQFSVEWGQNVSWGHVYVPAIPLWWLIVFYALLALAWQLVGTPRTARLGFLSLLAWCGLGLLFPFLPVQRDFLRCTFLSVGHGLATLIEFPNGETLLYDAGTIGDGDRAARALCNLLWSRGLHKVDAVIVSHADHDHFSGLFGLLEKVPVKELFVSSYFLDLQQQGVADLCEQAARKGIPIHLLQAEDRLLPKRTAKQNPAKQNPELQILYPPPNISPRSDNATSLVLLMEFAGRRILLTGDLEKEGLQDVLALPAVKTDILLSPHHGGRVANVLQLYEWSNPDYAVVSSSTPRLPHLAGIPETCRLLNTATSGAITFEIKRDGGILVQEYSWRPAE